MGPDVMKVVQVGCGGIAGAWLSAIDSLEEVELVGLVDLSRAAAERLADRCGLPHRMIFASVSEAVRATGAEAVFDTTVPAAHCGVTLEALSLGCHVLGEKPMSDTLASAKSMVSAAEAAGRLYGVTQTRRPVPQMLAAADFLAGGGIGRLEEIHSDFYVGAHFGGFRDVMEDPLLLDMAIHTFDNARQIGRLDPVSVFCHGWNPRHSWSRGNMNAVAIFEMVDDQGDPVVYSYRGSWVAEGVSTGWESDWRCVGARGSLVFDSREQRFRAERVVEGGDHGFHSELEEVLVPMREMALTGHAYLIRDFVEAVRSGGRQVPMCDCRDNIKSLAMVVAAVCSARRGQKVPVVWGD